MGVERHPCLLTVAVISLGMTACATMQGDGARSDGTRVDVDSWVVLGEIALEQQKQEDATRYYVNAALASQDPAYAERAARMAQRLALNDLGYRAVERWRELDPGDERAEYFAAIFEFRSGRLESSVDAFGRVLDALDEATLPSGIALILEALGSEPAPVAATRHARRALRSRPACAAVRRLRPRPGTCRAGG
jgi:tetratricopeptide (TPR) repeat protein